MNDAEWEAKKREITKEAHKAYNRGLLNEVKWNPLRWILYFLYKKPTKG